MLKYQYLIIIIYIINQQYIYLFIIFNEVIDILQFINNLCLINVIFNHHTIEINITFNISIFSIL